ncbi:MAG: DNA repair protein RecO [Clostridiaceae bacterium]
MNTLKTRAIVIKTQDYKENDKIVWLFTENLGKISCLARGAKKSKSKLFTITNQFCFGNYVLYKGKSFYNINEGEIIDSYYELLDNFDSLTSATYLSELIDITVLEEEKNYNLFKLYISCLYIIKNNAIDLEILLRYFEVQLLRYSGYSLNLDKCTNCGDKINSSNKFDLSLLGGLCNKCYKKGSIDISFESFNILKLLNSWEILKLSRITVSKQGKDELYKILSNAIYEQFGRKPKSLEMYNIFKEEIKNG